MQPEDGVLFRRLRVQGDKGLLDFENPVSPHSGATLSVESAAPSAPQIVSGGDTTFHYQLRHVLDVIAGRAQPLTGGDDAVNNMARARRRLPRGGTAAPRPAAAERARWVPRDSFSRSMRAPPVRAR